MDHSTKRLPWMPYYPNDFAGVTRGWPLDARGVFHELLDAQWTQGPLPDDFGKLRAIAQCSTRQWAVAWPYIEEHFPVDENDRRHNVQLDARFREGLELHRRRSESGAKGNAVRWGKSSRGDRNANE